MLNLSRESIKNDKPWKESGIELPGFQYEDMVRATRDNPAWVHFGAGNIFRGFIAVLQQTLLNTGMADTGIAAVEAYDWEIIDQIYEPFDNLSLLSTMNIDGTLENKVVGSISEGLVGDPARPKDWARLIEIFKKPSLQMVSFTITEKGYSLKEMSGKYYSDVETDMQRGPAQPRHLMSKITSLAYARFKNAELPLAFVSMDNCSHNGEKLKSAVVTIAQKWAENSLVEKDFLSYLNDPAKVTFPWTMIDKITPRPSEAVQNALTSLGFTGTKILCTKKNTFIAPFVNAEGPQYLVIEDDFPNGRMPLERAGVFFADRQTVDKVEKMKVCTCLNPLHTALAVFGCLLGYTLIADEMKDKSLRRLVEKIGYQEGLPVVVDPGIINPEEFLREVLEQRLTNPYIPDAPQRIATDTSQKVGIRFGETIKAYQKHEDLEPTDLTYIPLVIAGWCRYLLGVDDAGKEMRLSPDPLLEPLRSFLDGIKLGDSDSVGGKLQPILSNKDLFGLNLYDVGLGEKIEGYFQEMVSGVDSVRLTLERYLV
ncbi:mannitol-1-phosphate/altronate dehydrogenase [Desulfosporosinus acidiphilus SJ4]|uniref:Mannitol-1-phosphate/altronate dehydrogenase n=1 Tax=Desulfosporosinus acidiphilus (strain DSM 22704 / JCM 16185 / SJ4) TaxID=646529 RepID=I4D406_DESAJ|nr:mannitol dehydrogenase family protein [Desulfosporosinus acidiphilus]AFM40530.1 mannitol-1-phosphate/altronate dehydrogenase [Desulfosporosinus acidiphilus SJ4]